MEDQKKLINKTDWDHLIVLDACRFDKFEENYKDFLEGELTKAISPVDTKKSFATTDWCLKVFSQNKFDDVLYFSSTPRVNSYTEVDGFHGGETFSEVINLWDQNWNPERGTVLPEEVTKSVKRRLSISEPERTIIHYLQPHCPYVTGDKPENVKNSDPEARKDIKTKLLTIFGSNTRRIIGPKNFRRLTDFLSFTPVDHLQEILRKEGHDKLVSLYEENLRAALKQIEILCGSLEGKIIVTSDHGEYLGENNYYGHSYVPSETPVKEVPWLEVQNNAFKD